MGDAQFLETLQHAANNVFIWIGFGLVAGLLAKAIMPGRDPGGPIATLAMGCGGSVIGSGLLMFAGGNRVSPISVLGFVVAVGGAFVLLFFYRLLAGRFIREDGEGYSQSIAARPPHYRRRSRRTVYED
ncbi:MAG TPA: GlsB/YeaQ/YmgE family stress response membrane protein [Pirellulales bacterium]|jgi:uncharacterized membrane protein YeaQ/YmgE (transglycosylase-associated protein family)|nr:GlsB/YeaQ/YmgE family stress response membrane protein [Pirellulales bacterium]